MQTVTCLASSEFTDPDLGTFGLDAGKYCDPKCGEQVKFPIVRSPPRDTSSPIVQQAD